VTDPVENILGDYRAFAAMQRDRLQTRGIDVSPFGLSHLCFRVPEWDQYVHVRTLLERHARGNRESWWNGHPVSVIMLAEPLEHLEGKWCDRIELIAPVHQRVYKMGLEHIGFVVGDGFEDFIREHRPVLTGQQFQSANVDPVYILMEDWTHVKFYRRSFVDVIQDEEGPIEGFTHLDDYVPQRLVTATHGDPLPR
jgi:predicted metalloenzyme YecM